jgi:hypothetical protein
MWGRAGRRKVAAAGWTSEAAAASAACGQTHQACVVGATDRACVSVRTGASTVTPIFSLDKSFATIFIIREKGKKAKLTYSATRLAG